MDISIVIRKGLVYSTLITIITIIYVIFALIIENLFRGIIGYRSLPLTILTISLLVILFQPLKNYIQTMIDRLFFHGSIDQIDEENVRLRGELQKSEKLKAVATLAAGMAHEIKNPLTSIKTFTEYLPKKRSDAEFLDKFQKIVGSEVDRINNIVKQLLEFSRPSKLDLRATDINKLLGETLDLLNNDLLRRNIRLLKRLPELPEASVDRSQMKQVFLNLFLNARDAMPNGGTLTVKTALSPPPSGRNTRPGPHISVLITDTGEGIEKEDLRHIYDPFFSKKDVGTGLGLSVVHGIIEKHEGKIYVASSRGKGSSFEIKLPLS